MISIMIQYVAEPKVHSAQIALSTYVNFNSSKQLPILPKIYLHTVPNRPNVHHVLQPKSEKHQIDPQPPENGEIHISTNSTTQPHTNYERIIAHAAEIKFTNNRHVTPITVEFGSSESENSVNLPVKQRKIFIAIKLLDPSASITIKDKVITNPQ